MARAAALLVTLAVLAGPSVGLRSGSPESTGTVRGADGQSLMQAAQELSAQGAQGVPTDRALAEVLVGAEEAEMDAEREAVSAGEVMARAQSRSLRTSSGPLSRAEMSALQLEVLASRKSVRLSKEDPANDTSVLDDIWGAGDKVWDWIAGDSEKELTVKEKCIKEGWPAGPPCDKLKSGDTYDVLGPAPNVSPVPVPRDVLSAGPAPSPVPRATPSPAPRAVSSPAPVPRCESVEDDPSVIGKIWGWGQSAWDWATGDTEKENTGLPPCPTPFATGANVTSPAPATAPALRPAPMERVAPPAEEKSQPAPPVQGAAPVSPVDRAAPSQGLSGPEVEHIDGETQTEDWGSEYGHKLKATTTTTTAPPKSGVGGGAAHLALAFASAAAVVQLAV